MSTDDVLGVDTMDAKFFKKGASALAIAEFTAIVCENGGKKDCRYAYTSVKSVHLSGKPA